MQKKALIVDDEEALNEIIAEVLNTLDISCFPANTGEEAIEIAKTHNYFDMIIIDMNMPGLNGKETYAKLKEKHSDTPLIFMSGYDLNDEIKAMNLACPNTFLKKPFTIADLTQTVAGLLSKK